MYFASSSAPALTPLGVRLLALSRNKLTGMDCDNAGMLHRSVIVREAVRSAWASIEDGSSSSDLTNWRAPTALGLATLSEEDEDEDEYNQADAEARYLDDVLSTLGNDDDEADLAWAETTVSRPAADDFESDETFQAFTLPSVQVLSAADAIDTEDYYDSSYSTHSTYRTGVTVIEAAYDSDSDYDEDEYAEMSASWVELDSDNHAIDPLAVSQELEEVVTPPMYYASLPPEQAMAAELALAEIEHAEFANAIASTASSGSPPRLEVHTPKCETPPLVAVLHHQDQEPEQEPEPERQEPPETQNTKSSGLRPVPFKFASYSAFFVEQAMDEYDYDFDAAPPSLQPCTGCDDDEEEDDEECVCKTPPPETESLDELSSLGRGVGKTNWAVNDVAWGLGLTVPP